MFFLIHPLFYLIRRKKWHFFSTSDRVEKIGYIYTAIFHVSLVTTVYINIWILIPRVLQKGRYLVYFLLLVALIYTGAQFNQVTFNHLIDLVLPGYYFISFYEIGDILKFIFVFVALTSLLKLSKGLFLLTQAERQIMRIRQEKVESELKSLKSQINPHFLFRSLNNIYSLSMGESGKAPAAILKLSGISMIRTLENLEKSLQGDQFMRVHRSYIIALDKVRFLEGNRLRVGELDIPVGQSYRNTLLQYLRQRSQNSVD
jgi:hypothetical protein